MAQLYIVSAASGTGKTSLNTALVEQSDDLYFSISYTTRAKRHNETDGEHYHFVDHQTFEEMIAENALLEYAEVFGHYYGTSKAGVTAQLEQGQDVLLEIDWQGAMQVKQHFPEALSIFILPPTLDSLQHRLEERNSDSPETIARRLAEAQYEMAQCSNFDYIIVNDCFEHALSDLKSIIHAGRLSAKQQTTKCRNLIDNLLNNSP